MTLQLLAVLVLGLLCGSELTLLCLPIPPLTANHWTYTFVCARRSPHCSVV